MIRDHKIFRFKVNYGAPIVEMPFPDETRFTGQYHPTEKLINIIAKSERKAEAALLDKYKHTGVVELKYEVVEALEIDVFLFEPTW